MQPFRAVHREFIPLSIVRIFEKRVINEQIVRVISDAS